MHRGFTENMVRAGINTLLFCETMVKGNSKRMKIIVP